MNLTAFRFKPHCDVHFLNRLVVRLLVAVTGFAVSGAVRSEDWPYARITCDRSSNQLFVEQRTAENEEDIPKGRGVQSLFALTQLETVDGPSGPQDYRVRKRSFTFTCDLRGSHYRLQIAPWKFNQKINGECGDYSPSIELTVWRQKHKLLTGLIFSGFCNPPESAFSIAAVRFLESDQSAIFLVSASGRTSERRIPFAAVESLQRQQLSLNN